MFFISSSRSPALKPLWLSLSGSDADALFSRLFRKFFCVSAREYRRALRATKNRIALEARARKDRAAAASERDRDPSLADSEVFVPAYLLHLTTLTAALGEGQNSCLMAIGQEEGGERRDGDMKKKDTLTVQVDWLFIFLFCPYSLSEDEFIANPSRLSAS